MEILMYVLVRFIAKQLSGLNLFSLSNKNYILKKIGVFSFVITN